MLRTDPILRPVSISGLQNDRGDIVGFSPPGLVPHTRHATPVPFRLHRLYEAVEVERVPTTNTTSTSRQLPGHDIDSTTTMNAPRYQPRRKLSGGSNTHPRSLTDANRQGTMSCHRRINARQHRQHATCTRQHSLTPTQAHSCIKNYVRGQCIKMISDK